MIQNFDKKLDEYADLLVRVGAAVQKGQPVALFAQVSAADLARRVAEKCYAAGASDVTVNWRDDTMSRLKYLHADDKVFDIVPDWMVSMYDQFADEKHAIIHVIGSDPESMKGVDPSRLQRYERASGQRLDRFYTAQMGNAMQWVIGAYATPSWARKVFPGLADEDAVEKLWEAIFTCCRIEGDGGAVNRWAEQTAKQKIRITKLNGLKFDHLIYKNSLGTDLKVGLPVGHVWTGASELAGTGAEFVANIPTEEIFTAPHRERVDGVVYASMPLILGGNLVDGIRMRFEKGRVVEATAETGEQYLLSSLDTDEGARYLGEVALVPYSSPIRQSGVLFYNTLFDENASCHFAYGEAYPSCVEEGGDTSGLNKSYTHVDFMLGTADLSIVGVTPDGARVDVFADGEWAI